MEQLKARMRAEVFNALDDKVQNTNRPESSDLIDVESRPKANLLFHMKICC